MRVARGETNKPDLDTGEAAAYLTEMSGSLALLARRHGFDTLAYILEMAREEAQNNVRGSGEGGQSP